MENGVQQHIDTPSTITIKGILGLLMANVDERRLISLGMGDPTAFSCFHTAAVAEDSVIDSIRSHKFNGYSPTVGLPQTRLAIAGYLSRNLPYKLVQDDVYVTSGCTQAIELALSILARPGANILVPRPGFPIYELCAAFRHLEIRRYDLLPEKGWEADLKAVEGLADHQTVAMVIINPGNPCGNVYSYQHLKKIAETAARLKLPVIADEVYGHLAFGDNPFVPMGVFGSTVTVLTLGSLSKRWMVPGWRLGWFVTCDPNGFFKTPKTIERIKKYCDICGGPATFIQISQTLYMSCVENVSLFKGCSSEFISQIIVFLQRVHPLTVDGDKTLISAWTNDEIKLAMKEDKILALKEEMKPAVNKIEDKIEADLEQWQLHILIISLGCKSTYVMDVN